jgi:hypothetical protein
MEHKIIEAPTEAIYLSEFLTELPQGILNKGATGVGGTEMALKSPESYIIAVPTIEIIVNKKNQNPEVIGVYGDTTFKEFSKQIKSRIKYKIFTTYDSLPKTVNWLANLGIDAYKTRLLVDEYHKILNDYSYRDKAIDNLLKEASKFDYVTYLSATSIKPKFTPKILESLDYTEIKWTTKQIKLHRKRTPNPFAAVVKIITRYKANNYQMKINGHISHEAYFFVNSVKSIKDIIDNAELTQDEVKIICSSTDRNQHVLDDFEIGNVHDENKPFTFVTSKSFLGVDFYSDTGVIYVVSNVNRRNTLLDISTDITQIAGRIRNINNPFKDTIFHIYNTGIQELSQQQFKENIEKKIDDTLVQINVFNNKLEPKEKAAFLVRYELDIEKDYSYYNSETNELEFNELKKLNEEFNYEVIFSIYNNGISIRQGYLDAGFKLEGNQEYEKVEEDFLANATSISYQSMLKQYVEIVSQEEISSDDQYVLDGINRLDPSIKHAVDTLGAARIRTLRYHKNKIANEIYSNSDQVKEAIKSSLTKKVEKNKFYSFNECKAFLSDIYTILKIDKKCKGKDILNYLNGKTVNKRIEGTQLQGCMFL